jgi:exonuclease VII small subunit
MDFEAMIAQIQEMIAQLEEYGEEHAVHAAKRLRGAVISVKKAASLEPDEDETDDEEA